MDNYSLPRRIWRIVYPVLIFVGLQLIIGVAIELGATIVFAVREMLRGTSEFDAAAFMEAVMQFVYNNGTLIVLICNAASFAVFLPIWLTMRKRTARYENSNPVGICIVVIGFFMGFNIVQSLVFGLTNITRFFPAYEEVAEMMTSGSIAIQILAVGISAPVVEELVFRGILLNRMKWLPVWAAVLIQALLFSVVHFNLFQSLYAFLAGILLGMVYVKYRSIIMVILGHVAFNLISVILSELLPDNLAIAVFLVCPLLMVGCGALLIIRPGAARLAGDPGQKEEAPDYYSPAP